MALLDLNVQATSRLGLEPIKNPSGGYLFEGCVPTRVIDIKLGHQKHEKGEFKDLQVPVLQIEFENLKLNASDPDRFLTHSFKVVGSKQLTKGTTDVYEDRPQADILSDTTDLWKGIKHFLENLIGSPNYRNIVNIPKEDVIKYLDLPTTGSPADRLKVYENFFNYIVSFINGDGTTKKSQILDAEGKGLPLWVKVLPNYDKDPKRNAKYYSISRFINQGVFETMKMSDKGIPATGPKVIRVKPTESLELKATTSAPGAIPGGGTTIPSGAGAIDPAVAKLLGV